MNRRAAPVDGREHGLGDLLIAPDGTVFASDSMAPVIWKLAPGNDELEKLVDSPVFASLQGMALNKRTLVVADYANGLLTIDTRRGDIHALPPPKNTTLLGLDGLVRAGDDLIAVQNGVDPQRVVRIRLSSAWDAIEEVTVLAAALPDLADLSLTTLVNGRVTVIAGAGWDGFDPKKTKQPPAHPVRLFQISVP